MKVRLFKCKVFVMKISFHSYANKTNFHMKSFAFSLAFIMRYKATLKWPILRGKSARVISPIFFFKFKFKFKFIYFHILIKHKEQELGRKECGGVKTKTHGVKKCLHT